MYQNGKQFLRFYHPFSHPSVSKSLKRKLLNRMKVLSLYFDLVEMIFFYVRLQCQNLLLNFIYISVNWEAGGGNGGKMRHLPEIPFPSIAALRSIAICIESLCHKIFNSISCIFLDCYLLNFPFPEWQHQNFRILKRFNFKLFIQYFSSHWSFRG